MDDILLNDVEKPYWTVACHQAGRHEKFPVLFELQKNGIYACRTCKLIVQAKRGGFSFACVRAPYSAYPQAYEELSTAQKSTHFFSVEASPSKKVSRRLKSTSRRKHRLRYM
jgi:hypothetical protein